MTDEVLVCTNPDCARRYRVAGPRPAAPRRCKRCGSPLAAPAEAAPTAVEPPAGAEAAATAVEPPEDDGFSPTIVSPQDRATAPPAPTAGLGRYRDAKEIARGGMGVILRGVDPDLDRPVAIKVALFRPSPGSYELEKFLLEARVTGGLEHPNIVPVHEVGWTPDGRPYFAMKLIRGRSLAEVMAELRLRPDVAIASRRNLLADLLGR